MFLKQSSVIALAFVVLAAFVGCSDDNPTTPEEPGNPDIVSVVVSPDSVRLTQVGEEIQFDAVAFDKTGAVVDTVFSWQSSRPDIVEISATGLAVATGFGSAEIYVSVGDVADTAAVDVSAGGTPLVEWIAGGSGQWQNPANWSGGAVPNQDDTVAITAGGDYTVTLSQDVSVAGFILGNETGTQTLATGAHTLSFNEGGLLAGAELEIEGLVQVRENVVWSGGAVIGGGSLEIPGGANMNVTGDALKLEGSLINRGTVSCWPGSRLELRGGELENTVGALLELQGDAILSLVQDGSVTNTGTIEKSQGEEEAAILASSASFTTSGTLRVVSGSLWVAGGSLRGTVDIAAGTVLRQSGETSVMSVNSRGDGAFEIDGAVTFGTSETQVIDLRHVILDSSRSPAISGPAALLINHSFMWRTGQVGEIGSITTQVGSLTRLETSGPKLITTSTLSINGKLETDSSLNISLNHGAGMVIETPGQWVHQSGGTVRQGPDGADGIHVKGELVKLGSGALVITTPFDCAGTLDLVDGALTAQGSFRLLETGVITGGGTEAIDNNTRLIVVAASSAELLGTIRPGLDGAPARLAINGLVSLGSTFRVELDAPINGDIPIESVSFLRGGQELGGTLALNVLLPPDPGVDYRAISMIDGSGTFDTITGAEPFTEIIQDARGVLLRR